VESSWTTKDEVLALIKDFSGVRLDIGCGENCQPGFIGLDKRPLPGVKVIHDLEVFPYPFPNDCCIAVVGSHIIEHINPANFGMIRLMDELWRVMKPGGKLAFSYPYAGSSYYWQDPTHINGCNQATWQYFDPEKPLYAVYKPKPWKIEMNAYREGGMGEVVLEKILAEAISAKK